MEKAPPPVGGYIEATGGYHPTPWFHKSDGKPGGVGKWSVSEVGNLPTQRMPCDQWILGPNEKKEVLSGGPEGSLQQSGNQDMERTFSKCTGSG